MRFEIGRRRREKKNRNVITKPIIARTTCGIHRVYLCLLGFWISDDEDVAVNEWLLTNRLRAASWEAVPSIRIYIIYIQDDRLVCIYTRAFLYYYINTFPGPIYIYILIYYILYIGILIYICILYIYTYIIRNGQTAPP